MVRRLVLTILCVLALASQASANGRPPATSTITFRPGTESTIYAGMTFGLLISKDSGATWSWVCEDALPYGGMYDPDYALMASGTVFATTFDGLKVNRDGCVFDSTSLAPAPPDLKFFSVIARGPNDTLFAAAADPLDSNIYASTDDGMTFPVSSTPGQLKDWWQSLEVAPSDAMRVYLSGYRFVPDGNGGNIKQFLLFTSANGGTSWSALPTTDFTTKSNSTIEIASISRTDPLTVYARVTLEDNAISDAIYKTTDGGANWTRILGKMGSISFVVRANGDLVAGTQTQGSFKSIDGGAVWTEISGAPHISCLTENAAGEVWACTQNYGIPQIPMDGFGIMKTTDLTTWTGVLKYQEITEPLACPSTTTQYMKCDHNPQEGLGWCGLCAQLGCDPKRDCSLGPVDNPPDGGTTGSGGDKGCCETSGTDAAPGMLALGAALGIVLLRRRRRRPSCCRD